MHIAKLLSRHNGLACSSVSLLGCVFRWPSPATLFLQSLFPQLTRPKCPRCLNDAVFDSSWPAKIFEDGTLMFLSHSQNKMKDILEFPRCLSSLFSKECVSPVTLLTRSQGDLCLLLRKVDQNESVQPQKNRYHHCWRPPGIVMGTAQPQVQSSRCALWVQGTMEAVADRKMGLVACDTSPKPT